MLSNYSKLIGSVVGAVAGLAVNYGVLPAELATAEIQAAVVVVLVGVFTWAFPANRPGPR